MSRSSRPERQLVSTQELADLYGRSRDWALRLLKSWEKDQKENGGEIRVWRIPWARREALYTSRAVVARELPAARDVVLVKQVAALERDLDFLARRNELLVSRVDFLEQVILQIKQNQPRRSNGEVVRPRT